MINPGEFLKWLQVFGVTTGGGGSGVTPEQVQAFAFNYQAASGVNDAFIVNLTPAVTALTDGLIVSMSSGALQNDTSSPTLQINALAPVPIVLWGGTPAPGDIQQTSSYLFIYNEAANTFQLINPSITTASTFLVQNSAYNIALDTGVANAYIGNPVVNPQVLQTGYQVILQTVNSNTGASTLQSHGFTKPILDPLGNALLGGEIVAGTFSVFMYWTTLDAFVLMNPKSYITARQAQAARFSYNTVGGANDAFTLTLTPAVTALVDGMRFTFNSGALSALTAAPTLSVNGLTARTITLPGGNNLVATKDIIPNRMYTVVYSLNTTTFQLTNPSYSLVTSKLLQGNYFTRFVSTGAANAYVLTTADYNFDSTRSNTLILSVTGLANTGATTLTVNGAAFPIRNLDNSALVAGQISASSENFLLFDPVLQVWFLLNPSAYRSIRLFQTGLLDINGKSMLSTTATNNAVNYFDIQNAITGGRPTLSAIGADANIAMELQGKGTSGVLIKGAFNGIATLAGYVGETITAQVPFASATNINTATDTNLTSIVLTPGNWLVRGNISFFGTAINQSNAWVSSNSAAIVDVSLRSGFGSNATVTFGIISLPTVQQVFRPTAPTTIYLTGNVGLTSGTCTQCGFIQAIRLP